MTNKIEDSDKQKVEAVSKLFTRALYCQEMVDFGGEDWDKYAYELAEIIANFDATLDSIIREAEFKARLVELDLFEQFMNQRENKMITRGDLYEFKMQRLEDLEKRLDALKEEG